jgi:hypothetical protein
MMVAYNVEIFDLQKYLQKICRRVFSLMKMDTKFYEYVV